MTAALVGFAVMLVLTVVLPVLSFLRASAARDRVERLERRLASLEDLLRQGVAPGAVATRQPAETSASATAWIAPPPAQTTAPDPLPNRLPPPPTRKAQPTSARLETHIGTRWMLYVGVATLVIGVGLFIRYAFVNQWVTEPMRVGVGVLTGGALILSGQRFAAARHTLFGTTLVGGGIATWYLAIYAALSLYGLVHAVTGFMMLVAVTGLAAIQADRLRSQPLAMVAVVGGFGTPFLVGGATNAQLTLFSYTALLIGAIVYLAHRRDWPSLNLASFLLTGFTVLLWCVRFYQPDAYLTTELFFTLYAGLFLWVLYRMPRSPEPTARLVRLTLATTPLWYHGASLVVLGDHRLALLVYLIAVTGGGVAVSVRWEAMWVRVVLWTAVAGPLLDWADTEPDGSWLAPAVVTWLAVASLHTFAQFELLRRVRAQLHAADVLLVPLNGLGLYVGLQSVIEPHHYALTGLVAALLAVAHGALTVVIRRVEPRAAMHVLVVAITLAVVAVVVQLDGAWVAVLCATQGCGLVWLGLRERRTWIRAVGALLLALSVAGLLSLQLAPVPAAYTVLLNQRALLGLVIAGILCLVAWLHARATTDAVRERRQALATAVVGANALMLVTLSVEIYAFWEIRLDSVRFASSAELWRQMMLSATWGAYATALTAVGITRRYAPIRYLAIVVFGMTVLKLFTVDFSQLDSVYRIVSSIALGLLLMGASYLYQRQSDRLDDSGQPESLAPDAPAPPA